MGNLIGEKPQGIQTGKKKKGVGGEEKERIEGLLPSLNLKTKPTGLEHVHKAIKCNKWLPSSRTAIIYARSR